MTLLGSTHFRRFPIYLSRVNETLSASYFPAWDAGNNCDPAKSAAGLFTAMFQCVSLGLCRTVWRFELDHSCPAIHADLMPSK